MEPPVQYATTSDSFKIAFCEAGRGPPMILTPFPFNNLHRMWRQQTNLSLYRALSERFRLVHYDSRGQGMSERNLGPDHSYQDYMLDLEAVVRHLGLKRFVLFAGFLGGHAAVRYAAEHPDQVDALICTALDVDNAIGGLGNYEELAARSWESALIAFIGPNVRIGDRDGDAASVDYFRDTITQADFLAMARSARHSNIESELASVQCPTLVVSGPMHGPLQDAMKRAAASIPRARLVLLDAGRWMSELYTLDGSIPPIVPAIDDFMKGLVDGGPVRQTFDVPVQTASPQKNLSNRELEVLRLIARGRSNQEIAAELVLSVRTIERHITNLYAKIGARRKADATAYALRNGLA